MRSKQEIMESVMKGIQMASEGLEKEECSEANYLVTSEMCIGVTILEALIDIRDILSMFGQETNVVRH